MTRGTTRADGDRGGRRARRCPPGAPAAPSADGPEAAVDAPRAGRRRGTTAAPTIEAEPRGPAARAAPAGRSSRPPTSSSSAPTTLDPDQVAADRAAEGRHERRSSRCPSRSIENQALTVAAVDPATYRSFTPADSTPTSRTPGTGSPAVSSALKERLKDKLPRRRRTATCGSVAPTDAPVGARRCLRPAAAADRRRRQPDLGARRWA